MYRIGTRRCLVRRLTGVTASQPPGQTRTTSTDTLLRRRRSDHRSATRCTCRAARRLKRCRGRCAQSGRMRAGQSPGSRIVVEDGQAMVGRGGGDEEVHRRGAAMLPCPSHAVLHRTDPTPRVLRRRHVGGEVCEHLRDLVVLPSAAGVVQELGALHVAGCDGPGIDRVAPGRLQFRIAEQPDQAGRVEQVDHRLCFSALCRRSASSTAPHSRARSK